MRNDVNQKTETTIKLEWSKRVWVEGIGLRASHSLRHYGAKVGWKRHNLKSSHEAQGPPVTPS